MKRLVLAAFMLVACKGSGASPSAPPGQSTSTLTVTSTSFLADAPIGALYTCDGKDTEPQLAWSSVPDATKAFAIIVDDPDAPSGTFTHLVAFDLDATARSLAEGASATSAGGVLGTNDFGKLGYGGPCPPKGPLHHYRFTVYATDGKLGLASGATRAELDAALSHHVLAQGTLVGTFSH
jgi:Raf kinase inhibitor-like YbhB/YbcL family protein